jgi:4a-hydroxytetrahydrobiopterin dehydratase
VGQAVALSESEIAGLGERLPGWQVVDGQLVLAVSAPDYLTAIAWVGDIGRAAEDMNHHPDIDIRWKNLKISVVTHDIGNKLSNLDVELAEKVNKIVRT